MKLKISWICSLVVLLISCSKEDDIDNIIPIETREVVTFTPTSLTYAGDTLFDLGDEIGVYATTPEVWLESSGSYAENKRYRYNGQLFLPVNESDKIYQKEGGLDFYAYFPYNATITDARSIYYELPLDQRGGYKEHDLLWVGRQGEINNNVDLLFYHRLSLCELTLRVGQGKTVTDAKMLDNVTACYYDIGSSGYMYYNYPRNDIFMYLYAQEEGVYHYRTLIFSQHMYVNAPTFSFTVDGIKHEYKMLEHVYLPTQSKIKFDITIE